VKPDPGPSVQEGEGQAIVLLGGAGDLALRMLLPSLYFLEADRLLPPDLKIVAIARQALDTESYKDVVREALSKRSKIEDAVWARLSPRLSYFSADMTTPEGAAVLADQVGSCALKVIVFAVSPSLFAPICGRLREAGLSGPGTRLVLEKPVGRDLESSRTINDAVAEAAPEEQTFRIDHYLGKEAVQNLTALRFANVLFEPLWTNQTIEHVQITVGETDGVGDRWPYYDEYGALRDMLQNHMLQLLCLVAMEPPSGFVPDAMQNEKVKVLRSLRPFDAAMARAWSVRGQYGAGVVQGKEVAGYTEEVGRPTSTETFVALKLHIDNWRWAGVPFYLRTGKRLPQRRTQIVIQFKRVPYSIFGGAGGDDLVANRLVIDLQPSENIEMLLMHKRPGPADQGMRLEPLPLSLSLQQAYGAAGRWRFAYERLLMDVLRGDRTLFVRRDEVEQAWAFVDGVAESWAAVGLEPEPYVAGTWGPARAAELMDEGAKWAVR